MAKIDDHQFDCNAAVINPGNLFGDRIALPSPHNNNNLNIIKGLGTAQIILGTLIVFLSIAGRWYFDGDQWLTKTGVSSGLCFLVTGILMVLVDQKSHMTTSNGVIIVFTIISSILAFIDGVLFGIGLRFYLRSEKINCASIFNPYEQDVFHGYYYDQTYNSYCYYRDRYGYKYKSDCYDIHTPGRSIYWIVLLLTIAEFFIALVAAIYCCKSSGSYCAAKDYSGIIIRQVQAESSTCGEVVTTYPQQNANVKQQYNQQPLLVDSLVATSGALLQYYPQHMMSDPETRFHIISLYVETQFDAKAPLAYEEYAFTAITIFLICFNVVNVVRGYSYWLRGY